LAARKKVPHGRNIGETVGMASTTRNALLCFHFALTSLSAQAQTLYKSVGPDGQTVYSDRPPSTGRVEKTLKFDNLPSSPVRPLASTPDKTSNGTPKPVEKRRTLEPVLYTASWCGYCKLAKAWLGENRVSFQEVDVDTPEGRAAYNEAGASGGVPVLMKSNQYVKGFSSEAYEALLAKR
jgi:glutaredoxin